MFDFAEHLSDSDFRIRVECSLYATDEDRPIRLVICGHDGTEKARLKFTPERARDSAYSMARLLAQFMSRAESFRIAEGLQVAAMKVLATRN